MKYKGMCWDKPKRNEITLDILPVVRITYFKSVYSVALCWLLWGIRVDFIKEVM